MTSPSSSWQRKALAMAGLLLAGASQADSVPSPQFKPHMQECGSCHMAYQPGLLPATSWQRLLSNLPRHFGTDASVDAQTLRALQAWFETQAGTFKKVTRQPAPPPQDRITRSAWFEREHRGLPAGVWVRPSIRSAAQCTACHAGAETGQFSEHQVRVPS